MIMTIMIMKNDYDCFQLKTKCISKEKVCIQLCALLIVSLSQSVAHGPVPRKMVLTKKKSLNQD